MKQAMPKSIDTDICKSARFQDTIYLIDSFFRVWSMVDHTRANNKIKAAISEGDIKYRSKLGINVLIERDCIGIDVDSYTTGEACRNAFPRIKAVNTTSGIKERKLAWVSNCGFKPLAKFLYCRRFARRASSFSNLFMYLRIERPSIRKVAKG